MCLCPPCVKPCLDPVPTVHGSSVGPRGLRTRCQPCVNLVPTRCGSSVGRWVSGPHDEKAGTGRVILGGAAGLRAAGTTSTSSPTSLGRHALRLTTLRLGELRCYDDEAQVEHEERSDLCPPTSRRRTISKQLSKKISK